MHPFLLEYAQRFSFPNAQLETFFTQIQPENTVGNVPYMFGIQQFCVRVYQALQNNEKVCIYSDYDTDAVTATGTLYWGLLDLGFLPENLHFYAPDRFIEGYGMNTEAVEKLVQEYQLIISVDCGINSVLEAEIAKKSLHCDLIITDHHSLYGNVPEAFTVVNPRLTEYYTKNSNSFTPYSSEEIENPAIQLFVNRWNAFSNEILTSKNPNLSAFALASQTVTGVGVAWLCVLHFALFLKEIGVLPNPQKSLSLINRTLPLVAIGTIADCQSVLDPLNRIFVRAGLSIMQKNQHGIEGLSQLLTQTTLQEKIAGGYNLTSQDLAFTLSPILNSSGRLTHANLSISVLLATNLETAKNLASQLIITNEDRKAYVRSIIEEIDEKARADYEAKFPILWLEGDWSKGIIGLVASRLVSTYKIPCIVISNQDAQHATASLRAPDGYSLPEAMKKTGEELFLKFGGHPGAAGFSAEYKNLAAIRVGMQQALQQQEESKVEPKESFIPASILSTLHSDLVLLKADKSRIWADIGDVNAELLSNLWKLDPFGIDFPLPRFTLSVEKWTFRWLGQEYKHVKIQPENGITVTFFNIGSLDKAFFSQFIAGQTVSQKIWITATPSQNTWNRKTTFELIASNILTS